MRNNIASFEKTSSSEVKFWAKFNAKINSALIFSIILTSLLLVFSKKAILFLIYLLADKANYFKIQRHEPKNKIKIFVILTFLKGPFFLKTLQSNILLTALIKSLLTNFFCKQLVLSNFLRHHSYTATKR